MKITKHGIFGFILGAIIFGSISAYAATIISSSSVSYSNTSSGITSTNVQGAIDILYQKAKQNSVGKIIVNDLESSYVYRGYSGTVDVVRIPNTSYSKISIGTLYVNNGNSFELGKNYTINLVVNGNTIKTWSGAVTVPSYSRTSIASNQTFTFPEAKDTNIYFYYSYIGQADTNYHMAITANNIIIE